MASRAIAERLFLIGTILILGWLTFLIFRPFLEWVILGFLVAYLFYRPYQALLRVVRKRGIAGGIMLLVVVLLIFLPFALLGFLLFQDIRAFAEAVQAADFEQILRNLVVSLAGVFGLPPDSGTVDNIVSTIGGSLRDNVGTVLRTLAANLVPVVAKVLVGVFVFGFAAFYGFVDGPRIVAAILDVIPLHRPEKRLLLNELKVVTDAVFVGHVLLALIQAAVGTIGFLVLGVPRAFLWGFVMLLAGIVPVIGPFIVWIPVGIYLLMTEGPVNGLFTDSRTFAALGVLLVVGPIVSTLDNLIRPKLVGSRADIHPFLILVGVLGGLLVFGVTGFVVGPLVLALFMAVLRVYRLHWTDVGGHREEAEELEQSRQMLAPKNPRRRGAKKAPRSSHARH